MLSKLAGTYWKRPGEGARVAASLGAYRRAQEELRGTGFVGDVDSRATRPRRATHRRRRRRHRRVRRALDGDDTARRGRGQRPPRPRRHARRARRAGVDAGRGLRLPGRAEAARRSGSGTASPSSSRRRILGSTPSSRTHGGCSLPLDALGVSRPKRSTLATAPRSTRRRPRPRRWPACWWADRVAGPAGTTRHNGSTGSARSWRCWSDDDDNHHHTDPASLAHVVVGATDATRATWRSCGWTTGSSRCSSSRASPSPSATPRSTSPAGSLAGW